MRIREGKPARRWVPFRQILVLGFKRCLADGRRTHVETVGSREIRSRTHGKLRSGRIGGQRLFRDSSCLSVRTPSMAMLMHLLKFGEVT